MARSQKTFNHLPILAAALRPAVREVIDETCKVLETDIKAEMAEPKAGAIYPRGQGEHQASAPGEAPAVDYSILIDSVQTAMLRDDLGLVYEGTDYAPILEYGSVHMAPRPHMTPAAERERPRFVARMRDLEQRLQ